MKLIKQFYAVRDAHYGRLLDHGNSLCCTESVGCATDSAKTAGKQPEHNPPTASPAAFVAMHRAAFRAAAVADTG